MPRRFVIAAIAALMCHSPVSARNMWDINHGMTNPPVPGGPSKVATPATGQRTQTPPAGQVANFAPSFWGGGEVENRIPAGTVLTAILENDLSSGKNKPGDVFTLTLQDGFVLNSKVIIPPFSKILGAVSFVAPAKSLKGGAPGRIQISLQSLVLPDGRHTQIFGFIDSNPALKRKKPPEVRQLGRSLKDYGESVVSMGTSFIAGPGFMMGKLYRGKEFYLDKGEVLPIRLNQDLEVPPAPPPLAIPPAVKNAYGGVPFATKIPVTTPGYLDPSGPYRVPGFVRGTVPSGTAAMNNAPPVSDPNEIFNQPLAPKGLNDLPDPF